MDPKDRKEKLDRLKRMVTQLADEASLESLTHSAEESIDPARDAADAAAKKLLAGADDLSDTEMYGLEAIVLPTGRPVAFVKGDHSYDSLGEPWGRLNKSTVRQLLARVFPSVGRVELPTTTDVPYGGTAFVVGKDLLMTNRHVARKFVDGVGSRALVFHDGAAAIDFKREHEAPVDKSAYLHVLGVQMIHPYWDMALLNVEGLPPERRPLELSIEEPGALFGREVVTIGYPTKDYRRPESLQLQDEIFSKTYGVKRMHPGKIREVRTFESFKKNVQAMTHDCSTLGGNSGSAIVDVDSGKVVGLHFAGIYLEANYAVPMIELARDARLVGSANLNFVGTVPSTSTCTAAWDAAHPRETVVSVPPLDPVPQSPSAWTVSIQVAGPQGLLSATTELRSNQGTTSRLAAEEFPLQKPRIVGKLDTRTGYDPLFLGLEEEVPLPQLTAAGVRAAAKVDDDSTELKYYKFSVVMNRRRRLALFTGANVDWQKEVRLIDGAKPTRKELTGIPDNFAEEWRTDPRIAEAHQLPDIFYSEDDGAFDKGHLVRRDDVAWGKTITEMRRGNGDTYYTPNCSPQVGAFNQASKGDHNWGELENLISRTTKAERVCVFSGPVLADEDRTFRGRDRHGPLTVQIPSRFWKIVVAALDDGRPAAYGFVLKQGLRDVPAGVEEFAVPADWRRYRRPIEEIEGLLGGLATLKWFKRHDQHGR